MGARLFTLLSSLSKIVTHRHGNLIFQSNQDHFWFMNLGSRKILHIYLILFIEFVLGWRWLTKWYRFQVHSSTSHHLHTVLCVRQPKSRLRPSLLSSYTLHLPPNLTCLKCKSQLDLLVLHFFSRKDLGWLLDVVINIHNELFLLKSIK